MKKVDFIEIELLSDTAFSAGHGTAGTVDVEILHDSHGLPFVGGKTIRALLRDSWLSMEKVFSEDKALIEAGKRIFGDAGEMGESSILRIGDGTLEKSVTQLISLVLAENNNALNKWDILEALTEIRYQTAIDRESGAPAPNSLRSTRVIIRGVRLKAPLIWLIPAPSQHELRCLAMAVLATRHAGLNRNRGLGYIQMSLNGDLQETKKLANTGIIS